MTNKEKILLLLKENQDYISGEIISKTLNISRMAVNKNIKKLESEGYKILARHGKGYRLQKDNDQKDQDTFLEKFDILSKEKIESVAKVPCNIEIYDSLDSTNSFAKFLEPSNIPRVIISNYQRKGRGRLGKEFYSPRGKGLYMSIVLSPNFDLERSLYITILTALATAKALEEVSSEQIQIKWVNDIFVKNKKVGGILTEGEFGFETERLEKLIIGIGINCYDFEPPDDIKNIASSLKNKNSDFSRSKLAGLIIRNTLEILKSPSLESHLEEYNARSLILGKNITVKKTKENSTILAKAIDINSKGHLIVEYLEGSKSGQLEELSSSEVSLIL